LLPYSPSVMTFPTTEAGFIASIKERLFDNLNPFLIQYGNNTNASQTGSRTYTIQYVLIPENTNF
jgi:hypothetical protein